MDGFDALFVGGGVIGLASAWRARQAGMTVAVVDPAPGRGASWVAAGMLAPVGEASFGEEALVEALVVAASRWTAFAAELEAASGLAVGYRPCGTVTVAVDASDRLAVDELLAFQQRLGLDAGRLSARECRQRVPALAPGIRGGSWVPGDHQVDNRRLLEALEVACRAAGVEVVAQRVDEVLRDDRGASVGVRLADRSPRLAAAVVLCAGAECGRVGGVPDGAVPPVRPVKGHVLRLAGAAAAPLLPCTVRGTVHGRPCYLVPRADGSMVVGATSEERGFDTTVQAGAVHALLDDARTLVPGVDELELVECRAGVRPGSPDNAPFVGWTPVPRLAVASGHYRNGILLAPLTADAIATLLSGGTDAQVPEAFDPRRAVGGVSVAVR